MRGNIELWVALLYFWVCLFRNSDESFGLDICPGSGVLIFFGTILLLFWCQNSLLKLQSLLCSNLCKGASCKSIVQGFLDIKPDTIGYLSLRILCLDDPKSSVPLLVDQHPEVLLPFAKENKADLDTWKLILKCLQDEISSKPQHPGHEAWYSSMQEILNHLALY